MLKRLFLFVNFALLALSIAGQNTAVTRQETLRGTITPEREWWDVQHYDLSVEFMPETRSIRGSNVITFKTLKPGSKMQIDLQNPLKITKIAHKGVDLKFEREGNVFWVTFDRRIRRGPEVCSGLTTIWGNGSLTRRVRGSVRVSGGQIRTSATTNPTAG
jgi:hypothetical protein